MRQILNVVGLLAVCTACVQESVAAESVTKVRFGSLGRDDLVVTDVDIRGGAATNLVAGPGIAIDYAPEGTRISATGGQSGIDTNGVEGLIALYDRTNTTVRLSRKADSNRVEAIHGSLTLLADDVAGKAGAAELAALSDVVTGVSAGLSAQGVTVVSLARFTSNIWKTVATYVPWLEKIATNNHYAAQLANVRAKRLEIWQDAISNNLLLASADAGSLKTSSYFTGSNVQLVETVDGRLSADNPAFSNAVLAVGVGTTQPGPIPVGSVPGNAICWTNNEVRTFDGAKTVGAADLGAVPTSRTINGQTLDRDITIQAGVTSVNGQTGAVTISTTTLGAVPTSRTINGQPLTDDITISAGVSSVNGQTGAVVLSADSVEALPDDSAALSSNPRFRDAVRSVELPVDFVTNGLRTVTVGTRPSLETAPEWSSEKTYRMSDVVKHDGLLYVCVADPYSTIGPSDWGLQHDSWTEVGYGVNSFACGSTNTAAGASSRADGCAVAALGDNSHAEGVFTIASGPASHAEGTSTRAYGTFTHAEGIQTTSDGMASHAEGNNTYSGGVATHAEGHSTNADGFASHAEGYGSTAFGLAAWASGIWTYAAPDGESVGEQGAATAMGWGAIAKSAGALVWQGLPKGRDPLKPPEEAENYQDNGPGTFNVNPVGGASGFYIGKTNFVDLVREIAGSGANASALPSFSASDPAFATAVQSVVLSMGALRAYDSERKCWYRVKVANGRFELEKE